MSIRIPEVKSNKFFSKQNFSPRNIVKQAASDGFLPVIALEAFVEAGRTYQAYQRGGFDEARERITEEFSGAVFWMGGVTALNWLFEKLGQKFLKLPNKAVDIASDSVRNPLGNYLNSETTKNGKKILEKTMARFKFTKVISSVLIANAFIGFVLPKINQSITRSYHKNKPQQPHPNSFNQQVTMDNFIKQSDSENNNKDKKDVPFGMNLLSVANKFESDRNYKLLAVDAGTASGRAYSARNNDERVEILFRDLTSIYFYMFNMNNMNNWLNRMEQNGNPTRLDPVSAEFASKYMENYFEDIDAKSVNVDRFAKDMLGEKVELPKSLQDKFTGKGTRIIDLEVFKNELKNIVSADKLDEAKQIADKMSKLQPQIKGISILTEGQAKDILAGGHINNPTFLREFFKNTFGNKFMDKYSYVAQNDLDSVKKQLVDYVDSIISTAKKTSAKEVTLDMISKASKKNLKMNAINWGAGFVTSALFLSTFIPKLQYQITKWRTGSNEFPGTKEFEKTA